MSQQPVSGDTDVIEHEAVDRLANIVVTVVPVALLGLVIWLAWGGTLHWQDLVVLAISYIVTGVGTTVGDVCPEAAPVRAGCYGLRGCWKQHQSFLGPNAVPDSAKPVLLNRFDWYSAHDWKVAYPGDPKIYLPDEVPGRNLPAAFLGG